MYGIARAFALVAFFASVFSWVYARALIEDVYLIESDLYEYFLPGFLSPYVNWSTYEFGGIPAFADFSEPTVYPVFVLFSKVIGSWIGYILFAYVLAALGTYLYVALVTGSRTAGAIAGLGFGLSEAMLERLAHLTTIHTIAWMPVVFFCIEQLLRTGRGRWAGFGALSLAMVIVSGHPQPAMYACLAALAYAVVAGRAERQPRRYWRHAAALFVLGGALTVVKVLPFFELTLSMSRDTISFGHFVNFAHTPAQMWSMLFPTILHEGRESPTYVGLALTVFALLGTTRLWREWRVAFWVVTAIVGILFGLGAHTPFAELAYTYLPLYDRFRVASRHLILTCFGLAVLAGFGLQAVLHTRVSWRPRAGVLATFAAIFAAGLLVVIHPPAGLQFENRYPFAWSQHGFPPIMVNALWTQTMLALVTLLVAALVMFARRPLPWVVLLAVVIVVDGINAQPFQFSARGLDSVRMPVASARPSVHAETLSREIAPRHQRLLAIGATSTDALVPATWARIWSIPIAGGYGPMLLDRHSRLATMGRNGGVTNGVLATNDEALDVLAVNRIMVRPSDIESSGTVGVNGIVWEKQPLGIAVGRADCGKRYARTLSLPLPPDIDLAAVHATMYLRCAEDLEQGTEVGAITVITADGRRHSHPLRAGVDVAEAALTEPSVLVRARHRPVPAFPDPDAPNALHALVTVRLPVPARVSRLEVSGAASNGWLTIGRLTLVDGEGHMLPQTLGPLFLRDEQRWREVRRVRTSRNGDRGRDEDASNEEEFTIYENRRALPRAWLTTDIRVLPLNDVLPAIRTGQLPDGQLLDPAATALVAEEDGAPGQRTFTGGPSHVTFDEVTNGRAALTVSSPGGGFLVFSENFYRGWRAEIDGTGTPVYRADYSVQGVVVPPGTHRVVFSFRPLTLYVGGAFSLLALLAAGALIAGRGDHGLARET